MAVTMLQDDQMLFSCLGCLDNEQAQCLDTERKIKEHMLLIVI